MEDQLKLMEEMDRKFRIGDEVTGEILSILRDEVVVSLVGYMADGVIPFKELTSDENIDKALSDLVVGNEITAKVIKLKNTDGNVVLSRLEYEKVEAFKELEAIFNNKETLNVIVKEIKDKGYVAFYNGVRIFIPISQMDIRFTKNREAYKNQEISIRLIDFSLENPSKVIGSRRVIIEEQKAEIDAKVWGTLNLGDVVSAEIKRFTNFGAFASVNGVDGLIHLSQISWNHVREVKDVLEIGQIVDVKIIDIDKENNKLSLSIKALSPEPWTNINEKYPEGSIVLGKVVRINDFGAFVELEPGIDGLVHISKISHDRVTNPADVLTVGEEVKTKILSIDTENKKVSLSIKDAK